MVDQRTTPPPVLLYVPGDRPDRFVKAEAAAPGVILDLEDAVADENKAAARTAVAAHIAESANPKKLWVRVGRATIRSDIDALRDSAGYGGVMLADAFPDTLALLHEQLPGIPVLALVESASALDLLAEMARVPNMLTFGVGEVDLLADLGLRRTPGTAHIVDMVRFRIVQAAAAAGLAAPVAPTSLDVRDTTSLADSTRHLRDLGFRSRTAIHPAQCAVVAGVFRPSPDEVEKARKLMAAFERANGAVAVDDDGRFIDAAVLREARATLAHDLGVTS
ncbi:HpcH/HpaI aldolase/citrate lyase family protein [Microbacterium sp. A82]|uniref:HpcH/HpaI aldolase/citrate lyase family protein n=1 Tax=Microbacterium sp. A82 TaxID=3450452 RepID=UPI003F2F9038